jgi:hypothetical protein
MMIRPKSEAIAVRRSPSSAVCAAALAAVLLGVGSPARAGFTTYFGIDQGNGNPPTAPVDSLAARNSFVGALTGVGVETFESQALNAFPTALTFAPTSVTAAATTTDSTNIFVNNGTPFGTFATSGTQFLYDSGSGTQGLNATLTFSAAVAGFGLYATDLGDGIDPANQITFVLTLADSSSETVTTNVGGNNTNANLLFLGVVSSDPSQKITSVEIQSTNLAGGDAIGVDDLTIGLSAAAVVPEPASLGLLGAGVLGLAVGYLRRSRTLLR